MKQITIKELYEACKEQITNGNGNKEIVISDDNEGNGYHGMFYLFTEINGDVKDMVEEDNLIYDYNSNINNTIILG